ncbi:MAG TPA: cupredoxin family copper-binding protein, partial [Methylomirabilota bacterium]|nr:cupredoxin family copper-binding protein [Methylomirabilota bacterium]
AALTPLGETPEAGGVRHRVEIRRVAFTPAHLVVAPGDTVVWVNRDLVPHTLTAEDGSWDSGMLEADQPWELRVTEGMTGHYVCRFHPAMRGHVEVTHDPRWTHGTRSADPTP